MPGQRNRMGVILRPYVGLLSDPLVEQERFNSFTSQCRRMSGPPLNVVVQEFLYMTAKKITVVVYPVEDGFVAHMPLFPGCTTQGETVERALEMAKESLKLALYEPDEFDLWALEAYSKNIVVGTGEVDFPIVPGSDWKFGEDARRYVEEILEQEPAEIANTTEPDQWEGAVSRAVSEYGKLDILVNNAGITGMESGGGQASAKIDAIEAAVWDRVLEVNGKGVFLGTRAAIPAMRAAGGGSIVNTSSIAGIVAIGPGNGRSASYAASKGAVRLLTKSTAVQYGPGNIRCNSVHPGFIVSPMPQPFLD